MSGWQLAQVNIGRLREPLDHPQLAAFVEALEPVNVAAEQADGFVWRLQTEDGNATAVKAFTWDAADSAVRLHPPTSFSLPRLAGAADVTT